MPQNTEKQLIALEKQYWQAIKDGDAETAARLTDDSCIVTGAQGVGRLDKKALIAMMKKPTYTLERFEMRGKPELSLLSDDVAVLAYTVQEDLTVEGKKVSFTAAESSTWVKRGGGWRCAVHTESIEGDPFGRDRQARSKKS